ncbi:MAG TPA: M23 family metallopeptidase [Gaiella sp.]|nr:M23 family metallopeptidase [Gaiella sp.]
MRGARAALLLVLAALAASIASAAPGDPQARRTQSSALVAQVTVPGQPSAATAAVGAPPAATASGAFAHPADGSILRVGASTTTVTAQPGTSSSAEANVRILAVSALGGEITAQSVAVRAGAAAGPAGATGDVGSSTITGLVVLGQAVAASGNVQVPLADWGTLDVLGTSSSTSDDPRAAESAVTGLRIRLIAEHAGLPPGTEITIGAVSASAVAEAPPAASPAPPSTGRIPQRPGTTTTPGRAPDGGPAPRPATNAPKEPGRSIPGAPPELVKPAPEVTARFTQGGYVFPIFGTAAFGDTFGAFRADVPGKWHHGEDLVAPMGTPVLAVADGTLFSVGWNDVGGWRLWLRDAGGNEFYYAHLSAYSPLADAGRRVKAGDVLGFVGDSGDAEGGLPHLHFEIHPVELLSMGYDGAVAPYPFLIAWRRAEDVPFATGRRFVATATRGGLPVATARAGAVLLDARDISGASGLVPGALQRALAGGEARSSKRP